MCVWMCAYLSLCVIFTSIKCHDHHLIIFVIFRWQRKWISILKRESLLVILLFDSFQKCCIKIHISCLK